MTRISHNFNKAAYTFTLIIILFASELSQAGDTDSEPFDSQILINVSAIIVDGEKGKNSSIRKTEDIENIFSRVNQIWSGAFIKFEPRSIIRLTIPDDALTQMINGNYSPFIKYASKLNILTGNYDLTVIYAHKIGGMNGRAMPSEKLVFITDYPYVEDYRVTSHEIGHILGLGHNVTDPGRLMYSGSEGSKLVKSEINVARENAFKFSSGL